jgi:hypothetical protein
MKTYPSASLTSGTTQVGQGNAVYYGFNVTVTTATGPINIRKGSASGQIIDVIPAATAAGADFSPSYGIQCDGGLFVEFNGGATGTIVVLYE